MALTEKLKAIVGPKGFLENDNVGARYIQDVAGNSAGTPILVVRPKDTDEVSAILAACHAAEQPVLTQGGMTGLVQGALPLDGEVVLSLERMTTIEEVDTIGGTATVQAGVILQALEEALEKDNVMFPLDLGARGSCTIGGNLATNAGGNRVLRYGMTRDLVLGVEAVLADGTVVGGLNKLIKNNTGYDLKQLFIGSEGTLGVITRAVLKICPKPRSQSVAFCAVDSYSSVVELLSLVRQRLPGTLSAFEVMWQSFYKRAIAVVPNLPKPFEPNNPFYVIVETQGGDKEVDDKAFQRTLEAAFENDLISDAIIAKSEGEAKDLWSIRDSSLEVYQSFAPGKSYDVSLPLSQIEAFSLRLKEELDKKWPGNTLVLFGHLGDGNIHPLTDAAAGSPEVDEVLYELVGDMGGSISAEHGIGLARRGYLGLSKGNADIELMRTMKHALDPKNILNPGRIIEMDASPAPYSAK